MSIRILDLDIETSPALKWGYGMFGQNYSLEMIHTPPGIVGWATAWDGEPARNTTWYDGPALDGFVDDLDTLWDQLDEATHVEHFNGRSFDMKWINHEFIKYGIAGTGHRRKPGHGRPPSPYKQIDLMREIKREVRSLSNKLQFLSTDLLHLEGKIGASALTLWIDMYDARQAGDEVAYQKARAKMARYCRQDVNLLPKMRRQYLPWMRGINVNLYNGDPDSCTNCGGTKLQRRGYAYTAVGKRQRWHCAACGSWIQSARGGEFTNVRKAT